MNKHSHPLDYILSCCEQGLVPELFAVQNAKDELQRLRSEISLCQKSFEKPVAYAHINSTGGLHALRLDNNPYEDQSRIIPLYRLK